MLKIKGTQNNKLRLYLFNKYIGILDDDHNTIYLDMTQAEYEKKYSNINLNYEIAIYYNDYDYDDNDTIILNNEYTIIYKCEK